MVYFHREGGLLQAFRKDIKSKEEFLVLLKNISFLHEFLDFNTDEIILVTYCDPLMPETPWYNQEKFEVIKRAKGELKPKGWW